MHWALRIGPWLALATVAVAVGILMAYASNGSKRLRHQHRTNPTAADSSQASLQGRRDALIVMRDQHAQWPENAQRLNPAKDERLVNALPGMKDTGIGPDEALRLVAHEVTVAMRRHGGTRLAEVTTGIADGIPGSSIRSHE